ncbi:MAG: Rpn family recombination-promoting nuclease/putative transposase [Desmonostoc geniculatum HA4340-LM1]|nr:Rpn family recombination-promoting nuclease/putative transposase [Desmonostoc geniculatum HA4340-LM1]
MKTDTIFYSLFQAFPSIFFELINQSPAEAITYNFTSCEVKQLAFRLDGLFLPIANERKKPLYKVYQEALEEGKQQGKQQGKLEAIPRMIEFGLSLEAMSATGYAYAQLLDLPLEVVQQAAQHFNE